jgi:hypothetical protein
VPDLLGMTLESATDRINGTSLNLGAFNFDNTIKSSEDSLNAFVYMQKPEYVEDATIQYGRFMYLWLTLDSLKLPVDSTMMMPIDTILTEGVVR